MSPETRRMPATEPPASPLDRPGSAASDHPGGYRGHILNLDDLYALEVDVQWLVDQSSLAVVREVLVIDVRWESDLPPGAVAYARPDRPQPVRRVWTLITSTTPHSGRVVASSVHPGIESVPVHLELDEDEWARWSGQRAAWNFARCAANGDDAWADGWIRVGCAEGNQRPPGEPTPTT